MGRHVTGTPRPCFSFNGPGSDWNSRGAVQRRGPERKRRAYATDEVREGMGWETREECPQEWGRPGAPRLKCRCTDVGRETKSPSCARIDRLKPVPPRMGPPRIRVVIRM